MVGTIAFLMRTDMKANIKQLKSNFSYMRTFVEEEAAKDGVRAARKSIEAGVESVREAGEEVVDAAQGAVKKAGRRRAARKR
mmetsp:Transcript_11226/g.46784  ORF Transcript_11226/g.46784 Transcript_11226/m.46784 type:complete len:82 (+) Transcript_11226:3-248(+)